MYLAMLGCGVAVMLVAALLGLTIALSRALCG
jgi:hypothetical protein